MLPAIGRIRLSDVRRADVQAIADGMTAAGLSASTVHNAINPLRAIYRRAIRRDEFTGVDPTKGLELRRPEGRRDRIAAPEEAEALLAALPESERALGRPRSTLGFDAASCVRCGRATLTCPPELSASSADGTTRRASRASRVPPRNGACRSSTCSRRSSPRTCFERHARATTSSSARPTRRPSSRCGARPGAQGVGGGGPRSDRLHEARHTCASLMIAAGVNPKTLSAIMGHATIAMTFDTYGHLMPGGLDEAAAATNAYLARLGGERPALGGLRCARFRASRAPVSCGYVRLGGVVAVGVSSASRRDLAIGRG